MVFEKGEPNPLRPIFAEIEAAIGHGLFWLALTSALTIPGICSALESERHWSGRDEYIDWYNRYLKQRFSYLTPEDCYSLRCGVVHKGTSGIHAPGKKYKRVIFTLPVGITIVEGLFDEVLQFDAVKFCRTIVIACEDWYSDHRDHDFVRRNSMDIFRYHPDGLAPYIKGLPIIG